MINNTGINGFKRRNLIRLGIGGGRSFTVGWQE